MKIGPLSLLVMMTVMMLVGYWFGLNVGISHSMAIGPKEACEGLRWSIILCE